MENLNSNEGVKDTHSENETTEKVAGDSIPAVESALVTQAPKMPLIDVEKVKKAALIGSLPAMGEEIVYKYAIYKVIYVQPGKGRVTLEQTGLFDMKNSQNFPNQLKL